MHRRDESIRPLLAESAEVVANELSLDSSNTYRLMRGACLWEEEATMYSAWKHLPGIVQDGGKDGILREVGVPVFD